MRLDTSAAHAHRNGLIVLVAMKLDISAAHAQRLILTDLVAMRLDTSTAKFYMLANSKHAFMQHAETFHLPSEHAHSNVNWKSKFLKSSHMPVKDSHNISK